MSPNIIWEPEHRRMFLATQSWVELNKISCHLHFGSLLYCTSPPLILMCPWKPIMAIMSLHFLIYFTLMVVRDTCHLVPTLKNKAGRDRQSNRKALFLLEGKPAVSLHIMFHGRLMSLDSSWAQSLSGGLPCLMWSSLKWSTPWHASFPHQGQSWHSVISESTCFLLLFWLRALQAEDKCTENNFTKWCDKNNLTYTNKHTCHPRTASPWPCHHILLLSRPVCCKKVSPVPPPILFLFIFWFFSPSFLSSLSSSSSSLLLYLSPVSDGGSRTEWRAFEAGGIYRRRLNRWEIYCISKCSINSLCLSHQSLARSLPSPPSRCKFSVDFPLKHMLQLWVGCHLSL